jgi:hypothetical protein
METVVRTVQEAREWFDDAGEKMVRCEKADVTHKYVSTFAAAKEFFDSL